MRVRVFWFCGVASTSRTTAGMSPLVMLWSVYCLEMRHKSLDSIFLSANGAAPSGKGGGGGPLFLSAYVNFLDLYGTFNHPGFP